MSLSEQISASIRKIMLVSVMVGVGNFLPLDKRSANILAFAKEFPDDMTDAGKYYGANFRFSLEKPNIKLLGVG